MVTTPNGETLLLTLPPSSSTTPGTSAKLELDVCAGAGATGASFEIVVQGDNHHSRQLRDEAQEQEMVGLERAGESTAVSQEEGQQDDADDVEGLVDDEVLHHVEAMEEDKSHAREDAN